MKKIIIRFHYEPLRNETHVELHTNMNTLFVKYTPEALGIETIYPSYKALLDDELEALDVIRRSELTAEIEAKDHERDRLYRGFSDTVKGYRHHFDPDKRPAAEKLEVILEHYGNIARKRLDEKTAAIEDLYRELMKQENLLQVTALGLGEWLDCLAQVNRHLEALMMNRYSEISKRPNIRMRSVRKELDRVFRTILDLLESQVRINGEDTHKAFLAELNAVMERYRDILAQEAGRRRPVKDLGAGGHTMIERIETQMYTGKPVTPIPKVYYRTESKPAVELFFANDFYTTYKNNINAGMAELTVHGKGKYRGKKMATFSIAMEQI